MRIADFEGQYAHGFSIALDPVLCCVGLKEPSAAGFRIVSDTLLFYRMVQGHFDNCGFAAPPVFGWYGRLLIPSNRRSIRSLVSGSDPPPIDCVYELIAAREASAKPAQASVFEVEIDALHVERGDAQHSVESKRCAGVEGGQIGGLVGKLQCA